MKRSRRLPPATLPRTAEVAVVGSGPAGSMAALQLARAGVDVVLIERASLPRYKTCGGGLVGKSLKLVNSVPGIEETIERRCGQAVLRLADSQLSFVLESRNPAVVMTMRDAFDARIAHAAAAEGCRLITTCPVQSILRRETRLIVKTAAGECKVGFVVAADGALSRVAKTTGFPDLTQLIPALEYELEVSEEQLQESSNTARFDFGVVAKGYGWVFPKRHRLSAGILSVQRGRVPLKKLFQDYCKSLNLSVQRAQQHGHLIPLSPRPGPLARDRVFLTGDAAGLADPVTCEGISAALQSGQLAAQALLQERRSAAHAELAYRSLLEQHLLRELRAARQLARVLYGPVRIRNLIFQAVGQHLTNAIAAVMAGDTTLRQLLRQPKNYCRLLRPCVSRPRFSRRPQRE